MENLIIRWPISIMARKKLINIGVTTTEQLLSADDVIIAKIRLMSLKIRCEMFNYTKLFYKESDIEYNSFRNILFEREVLKSFGNIVKVESFDSAKPQESKFKNYEKEINYKGNIGINEENISYKLDRELTSLLKKLNDIEKKHIIDYIEQLIIKREITNDKQIKTPEVYLGEGAKMNRVKDRVDSVSLSENTNVKKEINNMVNSITGNRKRRGNIKSNRNDSIYYGVIKNEFEYDISISANPKVNDMNRLKNIIEIEYQNFNLPKDNKYFKREILKDKRLINVKQGKYCPIDKLIIDTKTFAAIDNFLSKSTKESFDCENVFFEFNDRLIDGSGIDNKFYFRSMLNYLYSDKYIIKSNSITKRNNDRSIEFELERLLLSADYPIARKEIRKKISNINDLMISGILRRSKKIIQWDEESLMHFRNIKTSKEEYKYISEILFASIYNNHGYTNKEIIFVEMLDAYGDYLLKNNVRNSDNLYYIISNLYGDGLKFYNPHIVPFDFPVTNLNNDSLVNYFYAIGNLKGLKRYERSLMASCYTGESR